MNIIIFFLLTTLSIFKNDPLFQERFTIRCFQESSLHKGVDEIKLEEFREKIKIETENELILYYEALKNVKISKSEIEKKILSLKMEYDTDSLNYIALKYGKSKKALLNDIKINLYIKKYLTNIIFKDISVSEKEIEDYYYQNIDDFTKSNTILLFQIFSKSIYDLKQVQKKLNHNNFELLAYKYSKSPEKSKNGLIGWVSKSDLPNYFSKAFKLKKGKYSEIIKSKFGYHIFWVKDKKSAHYIDLKKVSKKIELIILSYKQQEKIDNFIKDFRKRINR